MLRTLAAILLGYALGAIPTGVLVGRLWGNSTIHQQGSGHTGATNVARVTRSVPAAVLTGLGDMLLGAVAVLVASQISPWTWTPALAGVAAVIGHDWSPFIGFRGGIGLASLAGMLCALTPLPALALGASFGLAWYILRKLLRHPARATSLAVWILPIASLILRQPQAVTLAAALGSLIVLVKSATDWHRQYPSTS